jgi:hypothetical protein
MMQAADRSPGGPRWLLPADDDLIRAIGRAVYGFAQLERSVERAREALDDLRGGRPVGDAAGEPATQLLRVLDLYRDLKERRDGLLRARPHGANGDARRPGPGGGAAACAWRTEDVLRMARDFETAAIKANRMLRKHF